VEPAALERALRPDTTLVTIMHAQNEVGTVQPIAELAALTGPRGIWLHTDAAQSVGKIPVDVDALGADLLSIAGHKFYGPKGVGALYVRAGRELPKLIHGAAHENNRRAGTENVLGLVGLGHAAHLSAAQLAEDMRHSRALRDRLRHRLQDHLQRHLRELAVPAERFAELPVHGAPDAPDPPGGLPNTLSVAFPGVDAAALLAELGPQVAASAGAACHADGVRLSPVLEALQVPPPVAMGTVRLSVGRPTTEAEVDEAAALIAAAVARRIPRMG
jgi:cysteine desulfurase